VESAADPAETPGPGVGSRAPFLTKMGSGRAIARLLSLDLATKWLAYLLLPRGVEVRDGALFQLVFALNEGLLGSYAQEHFGQHGAAALAIRTSVAMTGLALALLGVRKFGLGRRRAILACAAAAVLGYYAGALLSRFCRPLTFPARWRVEALARVFLVVVVWRQAQPGPWKAAVAVWMAGVLGNTLSLFTPPFAPIDFVHSSFASSLLGLGIFNLADVYQLAGIPLAVFALVQALNRPRAPVS
jgi:lipoprotein signal peptidase